MSFCMLFSQMSFLAILSMNIDMFVTIFGGWIIAPRNLEKSKFLRPAKLQFTGCFAKCKLDRHILKFVTNQIHPISINDKGPLWTQQGTLLLPILLLLSIHYFKKMPLHFCLANSWRDRNVGNLLIRPLIHVAQYCLPVQTGWQRISKCNLLRAENC